jgi:sialate O-acetylesterase
VFSRVFGDHMVLPMNRAVPVWGEAEPGAGLTLEFAGREISGKAAADGGWRIVLPSMPASSDGAHLTIRSAGHATSLKDVLVGRVWLCSGQSNMDFPLSRAVGGKEEAAGAARYPAIRLCNWTGAPTDSRLYQDADRARLTPEKHFQGTWTTADFAAGISALAWWTARLVHEETKVPVGIVENAVGGSPMEAWLPVETLRSRAAYKGLLETKWYDCPGMSPWSRSRVRQNLGDRLEGNHPFRPGFLFESGVRPWCGFPFDAVLWYQGETNAEIDDEAWHRAMLADLVGGWRRAFGNKELPFIMIQLPRIGGNDPLRKYWPGFRKAQAAVASSVPGVKLVETVDLGWDSPDVHPPDKKPVAERAAALLK